MSAIEHDCNKLAFQHNLDNNFGSKQSKVSMKLMSVKSLLHTEIAPVVDSTFLLCPWNWYSTTTVSPRLYYSPRQESFALAAGSASSMQGMESCCQVLCVWAGLVSRAAARTWQAHSTISTQ